MRRLLIACCIAAAFAAPAAHAGLFDDEEARRAIFEVRKDARDRIEASQREMGERMDRSNRAQVELSSQVEAMRAEMARLRGQIEVLAKELADANKREKDIYADLNERLKKLEPRQVTVDGQAATVESNEQRMYEAAIQDYKSGDYKAAVASLGSFVKSYAQSAYAGTAQYMLGNAYYALRDYKNAIATHQALIKIYPSNPRAPDGLLTIASSQIEMKDIKGAKKTLESVVREYSDTPAAKMAKERLAVLK
jgi:tol-pal system protein YbgF